MIDTLYGIEENINIKFEVPNNFVPVIKTSRRFDIKNIKEGNGNLFEKPKTNVGINHYFNGLRFSRIVFNKDFTEGFFLMDSFQEGRSYYIVKNNDKWIIKYSSITWVE